MKNPDSNTNGSLKSSKKVAKVNAVSPACDPELIDIFWELDPSGQGRDSFLDAHRASDGSIRLSPDEVSAAFGEIDTMADDQLESSHTLTALAYAFLGLGRGTQLASADGTALSGIAITQAKRAEKNAARIRLLFSTPDPRRSKPAL